MLQNLTPHRLLLTLGLALLLAGWIACKAAPEKEEATASDAKQNVPAQATTAPGSPAAGLTAAGTATAESANTPLQVNDLPAVVAKVNGRPIRKEELLQAGQVVQVQLTRTGQPRTPSADFYRQVLNELIAIALLQEDAKAQGITASEQEIQRQIDARKRSFPNAEEYERALAQRGITEQTLRQQVRDQISVQKYIQTRLVRATNVSEQATRDFYEKNKAKISMPERLHLRHILVKAGDNTPAGKAAARPKAEGLLKRLQAGEDFAKLARENSDDRGSKPQGGDLGWLARGQTDPPFEKAAFALTKPNEISPVVESSFGFHIIQLLERQQAGVAPYEEVKERLSKMLQQQQAQRQVEARVRQLRAKNKVEVFL